MVPVYDRYLLANRSITSYILFSLDGIRVQLSQNHRIPLYLEDDKRVCNLRSIGWADLRYNPNVKFTREKVRMLTKDLLKEPTERERSVHKRTPIPGTITSYANTKVSVSY